MALIILSVIKWIFISVGLILAFILLITAAVLFTAIKYRVSAAKAVQSSAVSAAVKITFLFGLFRIKYDGGAEKNDKFIVKLLWHRLFNKKKITAKKNTVHKTGEINNVSAIKEKAPAKPVKTSKPKKNKKKRSGLKGIINKFRRIYGKIKSLFEYENKGDIVKYTVQLAAEELKALKPKKFNLFGVIGFESPDRTGYALGLIAILITLTGYDISFSGDFEKKRFEFEIQAEGKTSFFALLWPLIKWALRKSIWAIIKPALFKKSKKS